MSDSERHASRDPSNASGEAPDPDPAGTAELEPLEPNPPTSSTPPQGTPGAPDGPSAEAGPADPDKTQPGAASDHATADAPASDPATEDAPASDHATADAPASDHATADAPASDHDVVAPEAAASAADAVDAAPENETPRQRRKREKAKRPRRKAPWWELPALVALAIGIAILVKSFVVQPFYIPSDSMEKTLHGCDGCHGDRILVNKPIYDIRDPHQGDIVVFHDPKDWSSDEPISRPPSNPIVRTIRGFGQLVGFVPPDGQVLVKRVIATGGQTVKGDSSGRVMISTHGPGGPYRTLDEPYVYTPATDSKSQPAFGPVTVPKGRLWVMGDHRTDSADSRYHCRANSNDETSNDLDCDPVSSTVPIGDVIGKAFVIAWPPSRWRTLGTPSTFKDAAMAATPAVPAAASAATVLPIFMLRRRRRRR